MFLCVCVCVCVLCIMNSLYFKITPSIFFIQYAMNCTNVGGFLQQSFLPTSNVAFQFQEPYSDELKSSFIPAHISDTRFQFFFLWCPPMGVISSLF